MFSGNEQRRLTGVAFLSFKSQRFSHHIEWTAFGLSVNSADVFADNSYADQLYSADEEHREHGTGPTFNQAMDAQKAFERNQQDAENREEGSDKSCPGSNAQRHDGKRKNPVHGEAQHFKERKLSHPGMARFTTIRHGNLRESQPAHHAAHTAVTLGYSEMSVNDSALLQAEVAGVEWDSGVGQAGHATVKHFSSP